MSVVKEDIVAQIRADSAAAFDGFFGLFCSIASQKAKSPHENILPPDSLLAVKADEGVRVGLNPEDFEVWWRDMLWHGRVGDGLGES